MAESNLIRGARQARQLVYRALDPLDALFLRANGLGQYPPLALRRHVSSLGILDGPGYEFVAYLKTLANLQANDVVWDVGCGCGLLELALESFGWRGRLVGTDIHKPSIEWAARTIGRRIPTFSFLHSDIFNAAYWPQGKLSAEQWLATFDGTYDVVIAKSLFTHLLSDELEVYLKHISERLTNNGRALLTFFLLNDRQRTLSREGKSKISFVIPDGVRDYAVRRLDAPTAAVAYEEEDLLKRIHGMNLKLMNHIHYGTWSGREDGLSFQDFIIVTRQVGQISPIIPQQTTG